MAPDDAGRQLALMPAKKRLQVPDKSDSGALTTKQWLYCERTLDHLSRGQAYTQQQIAKECGIARTTVSAWRKEPRFRAALALVIRETNIPEAEGAIFAMLKLAQRGSVKAFEAAMRSLGRFDPDLPADGAAGGTTVNGNVLNVGAVGFYGLPQPPSPQQAEQLRPPQGSAMVLRADGVLEDRGAVRVEKPRLPGADK